MSNGIDLQKIGEFIGYEPVEIPWFNYELGGGYGGRLSKNADTFKKTHGSISIGTERNLKLSKVLNCLLKQDFTNIAGFYVGILAFFTEKILKNVEFCDDIKINSLYQLIVKRKINIKYYEKIKKIAKINFNFEDFLKEAANNPKLLFNLESALYVYRLQGNDAIFGILCQIFWINRYCNEFSVHLIDCLPITLPIKVEDWVSGCHFPVMVSPGSNEFKWKCNSNGWFLDQKIDNEWLTLDCVGTNFTILGDKPLANRINFISKGGKSVPYFICYNWGEVMHAVEVFQQKVLIRDLSNDIFNHYWFILGPKTKLNVKYIKNAIWGTSKYWKIPIQYNNLSNHRNGHNITIDLNANFVQFCDKDDIIYGPSEAYDWLEIGAICKTFWS